jgi:hypothetical protein
MGRHTISLCPIIEIICHSNVHKLYAFRREITACAVAGRKFIFHSKAHFCNLSHNQSISFIGRIELQISF